MADSATNPAVKNTVEIDADVNVEFNEATSRQQINSGESVKTLFGKLRKFLADLKAVAFTGAYRDLSGVPDLTQYASKSKYGDKTIDVGRKNGSDVGEYSTAEGALTTASGRYSHAEGYLTTAVGNCSHAEGNDTTASGEASHAGGISSIASGVSSFAHGSIVQALHNFEAAFGKNNVSNDDTLFSVGDGTINTRHNAFEITTTGGKLHDKDIAVIDDIPSELPANGGNADTVDGKHASDFIPISGGTLTGSIITPTDDSMGIIPATNNYGQIGSSDKKFFRMYATTFYGTLSGNSSSATKLTTSSGSATQPVYFSGGKPVACTYTLGKSVPSDAVFTDTVPTSLPANGGTADTARQVVSPSSKARLWEDNEGGNLELAAPDGVHMMQMDLYNNEGFRMYFYDGEKLSFPLSFDFSSQKLNINGNAETATIAISASNADTVNGLHAYNMATLNAVGVSHGTNFPMYCKHNVLGDNRFYIGVSGGYERSVAVGFAESAGYVNPNVVVKSLTFPNVPLNESGWGPLGITTSNYNIIGCTCITNDRHARVYRGNNSTNWYVYVTQQYPTPGVTAANEVVNVVVFYI